MLKYIIGVEDEMAWSRPVSEIDGGIKGVQAAPMASERRSSAEAESEPRAETRNED
jgi:hypothetical protein